MWVRLPPSLPHLSTKMARSKAISGDIAVIAAGRASIRASATRRGSSARSRRSSTRSRLRRSRQRRAYRSQPARAFGPVRGFHIRGIGKRWCSCSEGNAARRETRRHGDPARLEPARFAASDRHGNLPVFGYRRQYRALGARSRSDGRRPGAPRRSNAHRNANPWCIHLQNHRRRVLRGLRNAARCFGGGARRPARARRRRFLRSRGIARAHGAACRKLRRTRRRLLRTGGQPRCAITVGRQRRTGAPLGYLHRADR